MSWPNDPRDAPLPTDMDNSQALIPGLGTAPGYRTMQLPPSAPGISYATNTASRAGDMATEARGLAMEGHQKLASLLVALSDAGAQAAKTAKAKKIKTIRGAK